MLRTAILLALLLTSAAAGSETLRVAPGASAALRLPENPSTGYSWRLDAAASSGLGSVAVEDGGHQRGAARPGAAGMHLWTIHALKPGKASLRFAYQRPWEPAPVETRDVIVEVSR